MYAAVFGNTRNTSCGAEGVGAIACHSLGTLISINESLHKASEDRYSQLVNAYHSYLSNRKRKRKLK